MFNDILMVPFDQQMWYLVLFAWTITWKGLALWTAARKGQKWWFIPLLVVNTVGILEILYIYVFSEGAHRARTTEKKSDTA